MFHLQPSNTPRPTPPHQSRSQQRVGYSTVYNISNSLSSVCLGRLSGLFPSNYRLAGFLKWGFWRNNNFLPELEGKKWRHLASSSYSQSHRPSSSSVWRTWLLKCPHTLCEWRHTDAHTCLLMLSLESVRSSVWQMSCYGMRRFDAKAGNCCNLGTLVKLSGRGKMGRVL